jgi:diguanylate cyclase (GGDEF)-like protein
MQLNKTKRTLQLVKSPFESVAAITAESRPPGGAATQDYFRRIETYAHKIRGTEDVGSIIRFLDEALGETRALHADAAFRVAPAKLAEAERKIEALKQELEQLRSLVHVDHLTGALNRGGLEQAYTREAARADRQDAPLGTALLDIDNFKMLNDRHGHQAGDAALVHFAQVIRRTIRPSDVVVRYGGEEFLCLLPDSGSDQAARALRRLQSDLSSNPLVYMHRKLPITFSAGIAVRKPGESREELILRADRALYQAKVTGKNRAVKAD